MTVPSKYERVLLTGAAGGLGQVLREGLKPYARILRVSDREPLGEARPGEEVVPCELADKAAVRLDSVTAAKDAADVQALRENRAPETDRPDIKTDNSPASIPRS